VPRHQGLARLLGLAVSLLRIKQIVGTCTTQPKMQDWQLARVAVEADADELVFIPLGLQQLHEISHRFTSPCVRGPVFPDQVTATNKTLT
jgi:hypothetical protein